MATEENDERVLEWDHSTGKLVPARDADGPLPVADSWLVDGGSVRMLGRHWSRFVRGCHEATRLDSETLARFRRQVMATSPWAGRWFPRVEAVSGPTLRLRLRPAPVGRRNVRVCASAFPAEALTVTLDGALVEGALSSIRWWEGDRLCFPPADLPQLPAVTSKLVQQIAAAHGHQIVFRRRRLSDLDGREVWLTHALHGIRPVTKWSGATIRAGTPVRAEQWRTMLDRFAFPLSPLDTRLVWR